MKKVVSLLVVAIILVTNVVVTLLNVSAATEVTVLYDFENIANEDLSNIVSNAADKGFFINSQASVNTEIYIATSTTDKLVGKGNKALKISANGGYDWPPSGISLAIDGNKLTSASSIVLKVATLEWADENGMYFQLLMKDGSVYTIKNGDGGSTAGNISTWDGTAWAERDCGEWNDSFKYVSPWDAVWVKIPLNAEKMTLVKGDSTTFDKTQVAGLIIAGQRGVISDTMSLYIDEIYAINFDDGTINFEVKDSTVGDSEFEFKKIYSFEDMSSVQLENAILTIPDGASEVDKTAVVTPEIYTATSTDDAYIGSGTKALKITANGAYNWPLAGFNLALNGNIYQNSKSIVMHLRSSGSLNENGMFFQIVMADGSVFTILNNADGSASGNIATWNGESWDERDCGNSAPGIKYIVPTETTWVKIPLNAEKMTKVSGDAQAFDKTQIVGLVIAGQSGVFSDENSLYIDDVYVLNTDDDTVIFDNNSGSGSGEGSGAGDGTGSGSGTGEGSGAGSGNATLPDPGTSAEQFNKLYDFESINAQKLAEIVTKAPESAAEVDKTAVVTPEIYTATSSDDTYIGSGTKALKITANGAYNWPLAGFNLDLKGNIYQNSKFIVMHLRSDGSLNENGMFFQIVTADGSVFTILNSADGSTSGNIATWNSESWDEHDCGNSVPGIKYIVPTETTWVKIPLNAEKMTKVSGDAQAFDKTQIVGLVIAGQSGVFSDENSLYIDDVYVLNTDDDTVIFDNNSGSGSDTGNGLGDGDGLSTGAIPNPGNSKQLFKKLYDFEKITTEKLGEIITKAPSNASEIDKTAVVTPEIYTATLAGDKYIGSGKKALKITANGAYNWPLAGFNLDLKGNIYENSKSIVMHLRSDGPANEHGMFFQFIMADGSVYTVLDNAKEKISTWNGEGWDERECGREIPGIKYITPSECNWVKIPLEAENMTKISGNATKFDKTQIVGLVIAGQSGVISDKNSLYIDDVYVLNTDNDTIIFVPNYSPKTGDKSSLGLMYVVMVCSAALLLVTARKIRTF